MDDYNINVLSEAKSEYSTRLVSILTPLMLEGIKSIFNEAQTLCLENDEDDKYLMTFQNFLSRVPKWNTTIIEEETKRIVELSKCNYLEDLLTCVHITQLKILTSIRVSQKQKKIDIDIPKLKTFVHKCYITLARKLYSNVYLFEKDVLPLVYQKHMREAELMCHESILQVVRDSMPVETILRAYIDETVDEEIIEETVEKTVNENINPDISQNYVALTNDGDNASSNSIKKTDEVVDVEKNTVKKPVLEMNSGEKQDLTKDDTTQNINLVIQTPVNNAKASTIKEENQEEKSIEDEVKENGNKEKPKDIIKPKDTALSFNNKDTVLNMETNRKSVVSAPKTLERLEEISKARSEQRKLEEAEEDDDDEKLVIHDNATLALDKIDIHDLNKKLNVQPDPILDDIEVLT